MKMEISDTASKILERATSILVGAASIPYSALFQYSRNTMLSLFYVFNNSLNSPILGIFLLSMFNPYANHTGALTAFVLNIFINIWLVLGHLVFNSARPQEFDHHTELCANSSDFHVVDQQRPKQHHEQFYSTKNELLYLIYSIAPIWYCLFSVLFCIIFGSLLSLAYSYARTRTIDLDHEWRRERRQYFFFYRLKNSG